MDFVKLFLILIFVLLISRILYGKPLKELFSRSTWNLCSDANFNFLRKKLHSSTEDDIKYHKLRLACKKCPKGMRRSSSDPNSACRRKVKHYKSGEVDTRDSKCDYNCYKKRCSDNKMKIQSLDDIPEDYSKDYKSILLKCRPYSYDLIGV